MLKIKTAIEVRKEIAEKLRKLRLQQNFTQSELANLAGISRPTLSKFERAQDVSLSVVLRLCEVLKRLDDFDDILTVSADSIREVRKIEKKQRVRKSKLDADEGKIPW